jgi:hypothetical protein
MTRLLSSFGFPSPDDNIMMFVLAAVFVTVWCRDATGRLTNWGRCSLLAIMLAWILMQAQF